MKTIDEVIKAGDILGRYVITDNATGEDTICDIVKKGFISDALHYLREYRDCGACAYADSYLRCTKEDRNDPLSWDELKQMIGKPVWVIDANNKGRWYLVKAIDEEAIFTNFWGNSGIGYPKDFGTKWQAYRKERDHGLVQ